MLGDGRTEHLSRWAKHFRRRGDEVWVVSAQAGGCTDIQLVLPVPWSFAAYPMLVPVLRRLIKERKPDLLVAHYLPNYGLLAALSGFEPNVLVAWGSDLLVLPERGWAQRARLRMVAKRGQAFLVDAQMMVEPLIALGAEVERIFVCPFGVDEDVLDLGAMREPTANAVPSILSNRRHEPVYQIELLLDALFLLGHTQQTFHAVLAHAGSQTEMLKAKAAERNLNERISWPGTLDRTGYLESLKRADIYVSTARSDSTSVSLLEAMATGLAVVVPDIPGNREWVKSEQNGILFVPGDAKALASALQTLIASPVRRRQLGESARSTIEERGVWSHTIRRAELLFDQLTSVE